MRATRQLQIVILFAFITRLLLLYCFPLHMTDYMLINSAAQNLLDGHGMGFIRSAPEDLSAFYFEGLRLWPPLVTLTTSVFLKLTGSFAIADMCLLTVTLVGFVWVLYLFVKEIGLNSRYILYTFIVFALNPELIKRPGFSDLAAAFFCLWALLVLVRQIKKENQPGLTKLLFISFLFFLPSAFRYQYYPVSLLFPLYLLVSSFYLKNKKLTTWSSLSIVLVLLLIFLQECLLLIYTSQPIEQSLSMDKTGLFFFNLQTFYPFTFKTFLNISYIENTWVHLVNAVRPIYYTITAAVLFLVIILSGRFFFATIRHQKENEDQSKLKQTLGTFTILPFLLLPVLILVGLSLTHNSRTGQPGGWTYVNEGRYYIVPSILLLLLILWMVQQKWASFSTLTKRILTSLFVLSLVYNLALTLKFYYNLASNNIPDKEISNRADRDAAQDILHSFSEDELPTVLTYSEPYFTFFPYIKNVAITKKTSLLTGKKLQTTKSIRLLIISKKDTPPADLELINQHNARPLFTRPNFIIYATVLHPE